MGTFSGTVAAAMISAPGSGQGKSIVTAALARLHRNAGRRVRVFKHGPDYLDPMVLEMASGEPVYQLHTWMNGEAECRWRLAQAAETADLILVEGSMGLFDGQPSSADLAVLAGVLPVPVIDAAGMAQTFGAVAQGLAGYREEVEIAQVIANRIGSERHAQMLADSLPSGIELLGAIPRHSALAIPDRHLGIVQAGELDELDEQLNAAAEVLAGAGLDRLPQSVTLSAPRPEPSPRLLDGRRIAVARDHAFAFIFRANLDLLEAMGAELVFFSPLANEALPPSDALWLPGGYPELHGETLAAADTTRQSIIDHHIAGRAIVAECGGLMYCMDRLCDLDGAEHRMLGLLPGYSEMPGRLVGLGIHALPFGGEQLRGHTFHHSRVVSSLEPCARTHRQRYDSAGEPVFARDGLLASYFHAYFPSSPRLTAALFEGRAGALLRQGAQHDAG